MSRPRKLNDNAEDLLKSRMTIARAASIPRLNTNTIAHGFDISVATLRRYYFPSERKLSITVAIRRYRQQEHTSTKACSYCNTALLSHRRCRDCTILLHEERGDFCTNCLDAQHRAIMKAYGR